MQIAVWRCCCMQKGLPSIDLRICIALLTGDGDRGELRLSDMVAGLGDSRRKLGAARKALERLERRGAPVSAPLPTPVAQRLQRKAAYESSSKDVAKWQGIVKARTPVAGT